MKIIEAARQITLLEGKKVQINIAQISEVMKCLNKMTDGALYSLIKKL